MAEMLTNRRIKVTLHDATLLRRGDEKRHNFRMSINLSEDGALMGMADWIQNQFTLMQKSINRSDGIKSKTKLENMALGFWSTEKIRSKFFSQVIDATLTKFTMEREGEGDEANVRLFFSAYFPGRMEIHEWTWDHKSQDFWMDFEQQQGDLGLDAEEGEEEDAEEDE